MDAEISALLEQIEDIRQHRYVPVGARMVLADARDAIQSQAATITRLTAERDAERARAERAEAALRPFAQFAASGAPRDLVITQGSRLACRQLTMGDCLDARAALTQEATDGQS